MGKGFVLTTLNIYILHGHTYRKHQSAVILHYIVWVPSEIVSQLCDCLLINRGARS